MSQDDLRDRLKELHQELEKASQLSNDERDVLGSLMKDMVEMASSDAAIQDRAGGLTDQLEQQANDFENRHPKLAGVLRQIMDALGKMGI